MARLNDDTIYLNLDESLVVDSDKIIGLSSDTSKTNGRGVFKMSFQDLADYLNNHTHLLRPREIADGTEFVSGELGRVGTTIYACIANVTVATANIPESGTWATNWKKLTN